MGMGCGVDAVRRQVLGGVRILACLAAACAAGQLGRAAETNTYVSRAWWSESVPANFSVQLGKLNTNTVGFGSVLSIEFRMYATNMADIQVENLNPGASNAVKILASVSTLATNVVEEELYVEVLRDGAGRPVRPPIATTNLAPNTGTNWAGSDYAFYDDVMAAGGVSNLYTSAFNSLYFGAGAFEFYVAAVGSFTVTADTDIQSTVTDSRTLGMIEVIYRYTGVPEPGAWMACALGAVLALGSARRRRGAAGSGVE